MPVTASAAAAGTAPAVAARASTATDWRATAATGGTVHVRYLEAVPIAVRGAATGHHYAFSGADPVQAVDRRDAESLLRSRYFRCDA